MDIDLKEEIRKIAEINAFIAYMREAIKAKEAEHRTVKELSFKDWCEQESITLPEYPANPKYPSFEDILGELDIKERNRYYTLGAEAAIIPEDRTDVDQLAQFMERGIRKSKKSCIVIVSESPKCGALYYADRVKKEFPEYDVRVSILGHLQRGGRPSARDRILASCTGLGAVEAIMQGQRNIMVGMRNNEVVYVPMSEAIRSDKPFDRKLIQVLDELSI